MQKILKNRIIRNFKQNIFRYIALGFLITLGMYIVISLVGAAETIIVGVNNKAEENKIEDGDFTLYSKMSGQDREYIEGLGVTLEEKFYMDYLLENESVIRVFKNRKNMNCIELDSGRLGENEDELVIEKRYSEEHHLSVGDTLSIGGNIFTITGIASSPDYDAPYRNITDSTIDSLQFGTAFLSDEAYDKLRSEKNSMRSEEYQYSYLLNGSLSERQLKEEIKELVSRSKGQNMLTEFVTQKDNIRIKGSADDQIVNRNTGLLAGVIAMVLFTYVISVFVVHELETECTVIGALYALGVRKKELVRHYLFLPVMVTFVGGVVGTVLGYSKIGVRYQMRDTYQYFSIPELKTVISPYLIVYGVIMPPCAAAIVNYIVINRKLNRPALKLLRNEQRVDRMKHMNLGNMGFVGRFRIRQMIRERRTGITIFFGMFMSLLIMMIGFNTYTLCKNVSRDYKRDAKFEYMYTYKYPDATVPEGGEACYAKAFKKENIGYKFDVTMLGINSDNQYFDFHVERQESDREADFKVMISSSMAQKYRLKRGDRFTVICEEEDREYRFTVERVVQYAIGYYMFVDINDMRKMFDKPDEYYNVVLSDRELDIAPEKLYATTTKAEIVKSSDVMIELMYSLIFMVTGVSAVVFAIVMYLMMKVMIDRSALNISLMQIFGFRTGEIRKLYLNGNFYIVLVSALIGVPLAKFIMDALFPYMIANVGCPMDIAFDRQIYVMIFAMILILYFMINTLLVGRIRRIAPADVLKNRE